jgi:hypothetical protein
MLLGVPEQRRGSRSRLAIPPIVLALAAVVSGCGSSSSGSQSAPKSGSLDSPRASPSNCPSPAATAVPFPPGASSDVPRPQSATSPEAEPVDVRGVTLLKFSTAMPLRDAVAFVLDQYPKAGYRLVQGDSEGDEADAPFVKGDLHGKTRLTETAPCNTTWLVAVTRGNATLDKVPGLESRGSGESGGNH